MSFYTELHDVWMTPVMRRVANRALTEHGTLGDLREGALIVALANPTGDLVKMDYEQGDVLVHVCAKALVAVTTLWMQGDAKDDNRRQAQQLCMVIGQLTKSNGRW